MTFDVLIFNLYLRKEIFPQYKRSGSIHIFKAMKEMRMNKNIKYALYCLLFFFIAACTEKNILNVSIDNVNGLNKGDKVICKGREIGEVSNIGFVGKKLNIELQLQEDFLIPSGSKVYLVSTDIIGTRAVSIELSNETRYYSNKDTLVCSDKSSTSIDTTLMIIDSAIDDIIDSIPNLLQRSKENKVF